MTLPDRYFAALYDGSSDPWGFDHRWYEERKRALTLAALPELRYRTAFEPGCSTGMLTRSLADRCDSLLATDVSEVALAVAAERLADLPHVRLARSALPAGWPEGEFDLVVVSEVLYYLGRQDLASVAARPSGPSRRAARCCRCTGGTLSRTTRRRVTPCSRPWPRPPSAGWCARSTTWRQTST